MDSVGFPYRKVTRMIFIVGKETLIIIMFTWLVFFGGEHVRTEKFNRMG